jgi:UDP-glucuronate decarboxylase
MNMPADFTGPVNLGNPGEFTMLELAEKVIKHVGGKTKLAFHPLPTDDPWQRKPDIALAKEKLGWEPKVPPEGADNRIFQEIAGGVRNPAPSRQRRFLDNL